VLFYLAFRASGETDFIHFLRGYEAWMATLPYDKPSLETPLYAVLGITRTLIFPDYLFKFDSIFATAQRKFELKIVMDDRFLIADMPSWAVLGSLACGALACIALAALAWVALTRRTWRHRPGTFWALPFWVCLQSLFFALWEPTSNEFWIWLVPCLAILVVGPATRVLQNGRGRFIPWAGAVALAAANGPVIQRYAAPDRCIYRINKEYLVRLAPSDLVVSGDGYPSMWFKLLYESATPEVHFYRGAFTLRDSVLQAQVDRVAAAGGRIFLDPTLVMPNEAELNLQDFFVQAKQQITVGVEESEDQLLRFETLCQERGIPLYGIERRGGEVVPFQKRTFQGWLRYIDPDSMGTR